MAFNILSRSYQIKSIPTGLAKTSYLSTRNILNLKTFLPCRFSTYKNTPKNSGMRTYWSWQHRQLSKGSATPHSFFHRSCICKSEKENGNQSGSKTSTADEDDGSAEDYSEEARQRKLSELKQRFKTLLDDAESPKPVVNDEFDFGDIPQQRSKVTKEGPVTPKINPSERTVLLFPGQGAQFVGMGRDLLEYPVVKEMFDLASEILGYDLLALCLSGPKQDLDRTVHCQPAVLVTSLAAVEKVKHENIKAVENCAAAAGFSVGEYSALVFGGVLAFEDAIRLIKVRAEAMQRASDSISSGMLSVIGGRQTAYKQMCSEAAKYCQENLHMEKPVCRVANYLFQNARVVAGNTEALDFIKEMKRKYFLRNIRRLPVSGAFHTPLMASAKDALADAIEKINFEEPLIPIHANTTGKAYVHTKHIREQLCKQVCEPVLWEQTMAEMYNRTRGVNFPQTIEVGPGKQLGTMLQRFNAKAFKSYYKIDV